jgi:hypothetical protein
VIYLYFKSLMNRYTYIAAKLWITFFERLKEVES